MERLHASPWLLAALAAAACAPPPVAAPMAETALPRHLRDTGLYADFATRALAAGVLTFSPQYPLWTDGAEKSRFLLLPAGTAIDATDPDHWVFPIGTRLWKEFRFGRAVETRHMLRAADGTWRYGTYRWNDDGSDAVLAPDAGAIGVCATRDGQRHDLPSVTDCRLCHEGTRTPVLGFSALQLSADRDPLAPHAEGRRDGDVDLPALLARGLLRNLPARWQHEAPAIVARTPRERAALGYLHGNCSSCHNGTGPLQRLGLRFDHPLDAVVPPALSTALGVASAFTRPGATERLVAGDPRASVVARRLGATDALTQMPPFGRHLADRDALELVEQWIAHDLDATPDLAQNNPNPRR